MTRFYILSMAVALLATDAFAARETIDGYTWTYTDEGMGVAIQNGWETAVSPKPVGDIVIPSELGGKPVTTIGFCALSYCKMLTSVTIPEGVTNILNCAFYGCSKLNKVTIPRSMQEIAKEAFVYVPKMKEVEIPEEDVLVHEQAFPRHTKIIRRQIANQGKVDSNKQGNVVVSPNPTPKTFLGFEWGCDVRKFSEVGDVAKREGGALEIFFTNNKGKWPRFRMFTLEDGYGSLYGGIKSGKLYKIESISDYFSDETSEKEMRAEFMRTSDVIAKKYGVSAVSVEDEFYTVVNKFVVGEMEVTLKLHSRGPNMQMVVIHKGYKALAEKEWREDMAKQDGADVL